MTEKLYKAISIDDYEGEPVQYAGVYVTKWNNEWGEPSVLFVEIEESEDLSDD